MQRAPITAGLVITAIAVALVAASPDLAQAQDAAVKRGQQVYAAQKCAVCHSIAGAGGKSSPLDGVGAKLSAADLREWIVDPVAMSKKSNSTKKPPMPKKYDKLPPADVDALVAYMLTLK